MAPIFAARLLPAWPAPISEKIFGAHKTWRGMGAGAVAGAAGGAALRFLSSLKFMALGAPGVSWPPELFGAWLGLWALIGDLVKSFFKRRMGVAAGQSWVPFDQIDWTLGALAGAAFLDAVPAAVVFLFIGAGILLHFAVRAAGYLLRINDKAV